jgi:hypothetical protein
MTLDYVPSCPRPENIQTFEESVENTAQPGASKMLAMPQPVENPAILRTPFSTCDPDGRENGSQSRHVAVTVSAAGHYRLAVLAHGQTVTSSQTYGSLGDAMAAAYRLAR